MKNCKICGVELTDSTWNPSSKKEGHLCCKFCKRRQANQYYKTHKEQARKSAKLYYDSNREYHMLDRAKRRAKEKGLPFNIDINDIIIPEKCPILGVPFVIESNSEYSASLDRIIPALGYVKGNIEVISRKANTIKSNATAEEVMLVAKHMIR